MNLRLHSLDEVHVKPAERSPEVLKFSELFQAAKIDWRETSFVEQFRKFLLRSFVVSRHKHHEFVRIIGSLWNPIHHKSIQSLDHIRAGSIAGDDLT